MCYHDKGCSGCRSYGKRIIFSERYLSGFSADIAFVHKKLLRRSCEAAFAFVCLFILVFFGSSFPFAEVHDVDHSALCYVIEMIVFAAAAYFKHGGF